MLIKRYFNFPIHSCGNNIFPIYIHESLTREMKIQNYSSYKVLCNGGCVNPGVYSHLNDYKMNGC